jgi:Rieske Fe-S protein
MNMSMDRRNFLKRSVAAVNGLIGIVLAVPAVRFFLSPLSSKQKASEFVRVTPFSALIPGQPVPVQVVNKRSDAYTAYPPAPIGNVFLLQDAADPTKVRCMQVICPHLGCAIKYLSERKGFSCPCHTSDFDAAGHRLAGPSPRDMDELECRITPPDSAGVRWVEVKYQEFYAGIAEKKVKS